LLGSQLPPEDRAEDTVKNEVCAREVQKMSGEEDADFSRQEQEESTPGGGDKEDEEKSKKTEPAAAGGDEVVKLRICKFFEKRLCQRGEYCGWAHSPKEIGQKVTDPRTLKAELCKYHATGRCQKTSEQQCEFAHGEQELGKKKPAVPAKQNKGGKKGKVGKEGKGKAGGKTKNAYRPCERKGNRARSSRARSDSRSPQVLLIIIQTCSLFPLHQDKTLSAK